MSKNIPKLIIEIGVSASGKSTWAKEFVSKNERYCIVSRDDYRYAWQNKGVVDIKLEHIITGQVKNAIQSLISAGYGVIYDATNLKKEYIYKIASYVKHTAVVEFMVFDVPKQTCIERDSNRDRSVGIDVINKQYEEYKILTDSFDFRPIQPTVNRYVPPAFDWDKENCVLVDIDGTLAHASGKRSHYDMTKVDVDDVDIVVRQIVNLLSIKYKIVVVTGRDESCRTATEKWLENNSIPYHEIYMRKDDDNRRDSVIKEEIFWNEIHPHYNVICIFDDRNSVVSMWRELGIKCFQVEDGNF